MKIHGIANKRYEKPVLGPIRRWIEVSLVYSNYLVTLNSGAA